MSQLDPLQESIPELHLAGFLLCPVRMAAFQSADDRLLINEVPFVTLWDNVDYSATFSDRLSKGSRGTACDTDMDGLGRSPIQDRHSQVLVRITVSSSFKRC